MTPEKLKQRRRDRIRREREKAALEFTAKWVKDACGGCMPMSMISPLAMLSAMLGGIALAGVIVLLVEHGVI